MRTLPRATNAATLVVRAWVAVTFVAIVGAVAERRLRTHAQEA